MPHRIPEQFGFRLNILICPEDDDDDDDDEPAEFFLQGLGNFTMKPKKDQEKQNVETAIGEKGTRRRRMDKKMGGFRVRKGTVWLQKHDIPED